MTQAAALFADDRGLRSLADVGRTVALARRPELLVGSAAVLFLLLLGGVFGYALYVLVLGFAVGVLGLLGQGDVLFLFALAGASFAPGTGAYYATLVAVRAFGLVARDVVTGSR